MSKVHNINLRRNQKLDPEKVAQIKRRINLGEKNGSIAYAYEVTTSTIYSIKKGRSWGEIEAAETED